MHSSNTPSPLRSTIVSGPVAQSLAINSGDSIDSGRKVTQPAVSFMFSISISALPGKKLLELRAHLPCRQESAVRYASPALIQSRCSPSGYWPLVQSEQEYLT